MKAVASIAAILFFPLAVMVAIERTWLMDSLRMIWLATFAFVMIVGLVLGFVFGRARALVMFAAGSVALFVMWLPLQLYFAPASAFLSGTAYFIGLMALVYASLHGGSIGYNLFNKRVA